MKRRPVRWITALAASAVLLGCGLADPMQSPVTHEASTGEMGANEPGALEAPAGSIDSDTRVVLRRWECLGNCPSYSLSISGDGTVTYFGEAYVNVKGPASEQVSISDVEALVDQMLQAEYFSLSVPDACPAGLYSDAPGATTSLTLHGQTHTVDHDYGNSCAPASLRPLEDAIDVLAGSAIWIECDTPSGACCDMTVNPYLSCD